MFRCCNRPPVKFSIVFETLRIEPYKLVRGYAQDIVERTKNIFYQSLNLLGLSKEQEEGAAIKAPIIDQTRTLAEIEQVFEIYRSGLLSILTDTQVKKYTDIPPETVRKDLFALLEENKMAFCQFLINLKINFYVKFRFHYSPTEEAKVLFNLIRLLSENSELTDAKIWLPSEDVFSLDILNNTIVFSPQNFFRSPKSLQFAILHEIGHIAHQNEHGLHFFIFDVCSYVFLTFQIYLLALIAMSMNPLTMNPSRIYDLIIPIMAITALFALNFSLSCFSNMFMSHIKKHYADSYAAMIQNTNEHKNNYCSDQLISCMVFKDLNHRHERNNLSFKDLLSAANSSLLSYSHPTAASRIDLDFSTAAQIVARRTLKMKPLDLELDSSRHLRVIQEKAAEFLRKEDLL